MTTRDSADRPEIITKTEARQATGNRMNLRVLIGSLFIVVAIFAILYAVFMSGSNLVPNAG